MKKAPHSEEQIAEQIVLWLQSLDWTVYQEVQRYAQGNVADIVATQDRLIWIIETKTTLGLDVMEQAYRWKHHAHFVSVGVPDRRNNAGFKLGILRHLGLGCLSVAEMFGGEWQVKEETRPELNKRLVAGLREKLRPEHQTWAKAGNNRSERYSPFKGTCRDVAEFVKQNPGTTLKQLIDSVPTHYQSTSTARSCLKHWIEAGKLDGVRLERDGKFIKLYPQEAA